MLFHGQYDALGVVQDKQHTQSTQSFASLIYLKVPPNKLKTQLTKVLAEGQILMLMDTIPSEFRANAISVTGF
jgi:hypothetical protein